MDWQALLRGVTEFLRTTGVRVLFALFFLFLSFRIINFLARRIEKKKNLKRYDKTLTRSLLSLGKTLSKVLVVGALVGYLGIDTSGFAALLTSLGVGVGLAVNGALSNMAGGALLLLARPFRIDDYIECGGYEGTVEDIRLVSTRLRTIDNKVVYLPNASVASGTIINYSEEPFRRLDLPLTVSYENDIAAVREIILSLFSKDARVLRDPEPVVTLGGYVASGAELICKAWVKNEDYWDARFDLLEAIQRSLKDAGIRFPGTRIDLL